MQVIKLRLTSENIPARFNPPVDDPRDQGQILTKFKPSLKQPSMYRVILLNDDFTPMDFVILVLKRFFRKTEEEATKIMLEVHQQGAGLAGVYTHEIAETKVYLVNEFSRTHQHPLKCVMEAESSSQKED